MTDLVSFDDETIFSYVESNLTPQLESSNTFEITLTINRTKKRIHDHLLSNADTENLAEFALILTQLVRIGLLPEHRRTKAIYEVLQFICNRKSLVA